MYASLRVQQLKNAASCCTGGSARNVAASAREEARRDLVRGDVGANAFEVNADGAPTREREERKTVRVGEVEMKRVGVGDECGFAVRAVCEAQRRWFVVEVACENDTQRAARDDEVIAVRREVETCGALLLVNAKEAMQFRDARIAHRE